MNHKRQLLWNKILDLSIQMQDLAVPNQSLADLAVDDEYASQPWKAISELEKERRILLADFFSEKVLPNESLEIRECIIQLQKIDNELIAISQNVKNEIGSEFSKLSNVQRAVSAYTENTSRKS